MTVATAGMNQSSLATRIIEQEENSCEVKLSHLLKYLALRETTEYNDRYLALAGSVTTFVLETTEIY